jgi:hypothetical protein
VRPCSPAGESGSSVTFAGFFVLMGKG